MGKREEEINASATAARNSFKRDADHLSERSRVVSGDIPDSRSVELGQEAQGLHCLLRDDFPRRQRVRKKRYAKRFRDMECNAMR